jgi:hypothetical protein
MALWTGMDWWVDMLKSGSFGLRGGVGRGLSRKIGRARKVGAMSGGRMLIGGWIGEDDLMLALAPSVSE